MPLSVPQVRGPFRLRNSSPDRGPQKNQAAPAFTPGVPEFACLRPDGRWRRRLQASHSVSEPRHGATTAQIRCGAR